MACILLIEDDDEFRTALRLGLAHWGHTVIEARNGKEGLDLFPHVDADLIITDIVMPEKEGLAVLMELRAKRPPVKIIAMSGGGRQPAVGYLAMAKHLGAARVLEKPFSIESMIAAINDVLASGGPPARPSPPK